MSEVLNHLDPSEGWGEPISVYTDAQAADAARHGRHEQFIAALDQRKEELAEEVRALLHGQFVTRDPKRHN